MEGPWRSHCEGTWNSCWPYSLWAHHPKPPDRGEFFWGLFFFVFTESHPVQCEFPNLGVLTQLTSTYSQSFFPQSKWGDLGDISSTNPSPPPDPGPPPSAAQSYEKSPLRRCCDCSGRRDPCWHDDWCLCHWRSHPPIFEYCLKKKADIDMGRKTKKKGKQTRIRVSGLLEIKKVKGESKDFQRNNDLTM